MRTVFQPNNSGLFSACACSAIAGIHLDVATDTAQSLADEVRCLERWPKELGKTCIVCKTGWPLTCASIVCRMSSTSHLTYAVSLHYLLSHKRASEGLYSVYRA